MKTDARTVPQDGRGRFSVRLGFLIIPCVVLAVAAILWTEGVIRRPTERSTDDIAATAEMTVQLAPNFAVPVDGPPFLRGELSVYRGSPSSLPSEAAIAVLADATHITLSPTGPDERQFVDLHPRLEALMLIGSMGETAIAIHTESSSLIQPSRCVLIGAANSSFGGCAATGAFSLTGEDESWLVWVDVPDGTALVVLRDPSGLDSMYQTPTADTVVFQSVAVGSTLVALRPDGSAIETSTG